MASEKCREGFNQQQSFQGTRVARLRSYLFGSILQVLCIMQSDLMDIDLMS